MQAIKLFFSVMRVWLLASILIVFALLMIPLDVQAAVWPSMEVSWKENLTRVDGKALTRAELSEYRIYIKVPGSTTFNQLTAIKAEEKKDYVYTFKPTAPKAGEHCFHVTVVDTRALESAPSTNVCAPYTQYVEPSAPATVRVTLTIEAGPAP